MPVTMQPRPRPSPMHPVAHRRAADATWCQAPDVPTLCMQCIVPGTAVHRPAQGYVQDARGYRFGVCSHCAARWQATGHLVVIDRPGVAP